MSKNSPVSLEAHDKFSDPPAEIARGGCWRWRPSRASCSPAATGSKGRTAARRRFEAAASRGARYFTGAGPVSVRIPKTRSCPGEPAAFRSAPVPPQVRKAASVEAFVPWLHLKGASSGEMAETLQVLPGPEARGFSA